MNKNTLSGQSKKLASSIRMGCIGLGKGDDALKTLLGSCIGLTLFDHVNCLGALAHIVLPDSTGHDGPAGKFVDTAVPELVKLIEQQGGKLGHLTAKIVGGASMFQSNAASDIGDRNIKATERYLEKLGIPITARHCGGKMGRRVNFFPGSGRVRIEIVGQDVIEI